MAMSFIPAQARLTNLSLMDVPSHYYTDAVLIYLSLFNDLHDGLSFGFHSMCGSSWFSYSSS